MIASSAETQAFSRLFLRPGLLTGTVVVLALSLGLAQAQTTQPGSAPTPLFLLPNTPDEAPAEPDTAAADAEEGAVSTAPQDEADQPARASGPTAPAGIEVDALGNDPLESIGLLDSDNGGLVCESALSNTLNTRSSVSASTSPDSNI